MDLGKINRLTGSFTNTGNARNFKTSGKTESANLQDQVDISGGASKGDILKMAQKAMTDFRSSLVDTISQGKKDSKNAPLYQLTGTPVDDFITNRFANLDGATKAEFMQMFSDLSNTSGGLASQSLISNTFGNSYGFGEMIGTIGRSLNSYL